jgi:hypothetical protein
VGEERGEGMMNCQRRRGKRLFIPIPRMGSILRCRAGKNVEHQKI